jgi:predicted enzyme related to lactoylglutathione lyase
MSPIIGFDVSKRTPGFWGIDIDAPRRNPREVQPIRWRSPVDKVVHFEIPFENKERAMTFYSQCFGWQLQDMPAMQYVIAQTVDVGENQMPKEPGAINGGLFQRPKEAPSPTLYIGVASVDAAIKKVQSAGGKVVTPKTPIPGMGAYGRVSDTEGNVIGLFEGAGG